MSSGARPRWPWGGEAALPTTAQRTCLQANCSLRHPKVFGSNSKRISLLYPASAAVEQECGTPSTPRGPPTPTIMLRQNTTISTKTSMQHAEPRSSFYITSITCKVTSASPCPLPRPLRALHPHCPTNCCPRQYPRQLPRGPHDRMVYRWRLMYSTISLYLSSPVSSIRDPSLRKTTCGSGHGTKHRDV